MCGSTELIKQDGLFICKFCGCKYTVVDAKEVTKYRCPLCGYGSDNEYSSLDASIINTLTQSMVMIVFQALLEIDMKKLNAGNSMKPRNGS